MTRICAWGVAAAAVSSLLACSASDGSTPGSAGGSSNSSAGAAASIPVTNVVTTEKLGELHSGDGTYYTFADGSGACMYDKTSDFQNRSAERFRLGRQRLVRCVRGRDGPEWQSAARADRR